jgi:hypothetical protein
MRDLDQIGWNTFFFCLGHPNRIRLGRIRLDYIGLD